jgi:hypothetical protein
VRAKNTGLLRNLSRLAFMPVGIARPVSGHLIMTTPILLLPGFRIGGRFVRRRLECALLVGALVPADPGGLQKFE